MDQRHRQYHAVSDPVTIAARHLEVESKRVGAADRRVDWMVAAMLAVLAVLCTVFAAQVEHYGRDTSSYLLLARSIVQDGSYTFNYEPHTVYPPGLPLVLAGLMALGVESFTGLIRATIPIFFAGLWGCYWLLRMVDRRAALLVTVLTATCYSAFFLITAGLHSEIPYFACSVAALLCVAAAGRIEGTRSRLLVIAAGSLLVAFLPLIRTMGVTLAAGLALWIVYPALAFWRPSAESTLTRLRRWGPAVALTAVVLAGWMQWGRSNDSGYAGEAFMSSYAEQLMKSDPHDLGSPQIAATDVPVRAAHMLALRAQRTARTLLNQPSLDLSKANPITLLALLLVSAGLIRSFRTRGTVVDCYFLAYMGLLVLWPFDEGSRFLFPVLPFLYFYGIEGLRVTVGLLQRRLRREQKPALQKLQRRLAGAAVVVIVASGIYHSARLAVGYRDADPTTFHVYPTVAGADWIRQNTPADAVIVDEQFSIVHRLTGRRSYRFPLVVDGARISEIIAGTGADYVVVLHERPHEYFLPSVERRFQDARAAAPDMYSLVHEFEYGRIYRIHGDGETDGASAEVAEPNPSG